MKGGTGILFFCFFQSVFWKSEGKLYSGFANSPCFPFTWIFTIDLLTVVQNYKYFCLGVRMFHLAALHVNHWNCLFSDLQRTKWSLCLNSANWHFTFICFCLSGILTNSFFFFFFFTIWQGALHFSTSLAIYYFCNLESLTPFHFSSENFKKMKVLTKAHMRSNMMSHILLAFFSFLLLKCPFIWFLGKPTLKNVFTSDQSNNQI